MTLQKLKENSRCGKMIEDLVLYKSTRFPLDEISGFFDNLGEINRDQGV